MEVVVVVDKGMDVVVVVVVDGSMLVGLNLSRRVAGEYRGARLAILT